MSGQKCAGRVSYGSWGRSRECKHGGSLEHEGRFYCKLHHPPTAKAKRDASYEAHYSKWQADRAAAKELARRAACFPELLEALKGCAWICKERDPVAYAAAQSAITKAENKETR